MGEGNLTPKRVVWEAQSVLLVANESGAYVKVTMGSIAEHTGYNAPLLQRFQVAAICASDPGVAKRIHIGG